MKAVVLIGFLALASATVTQASTGADLQTFSAENIKNHHSYGLFFTEKDEGFLATVGSLFSSDKEAEFKNQLVDSDQVALLNINV